MWALDGGGVNEGFYFYCRNFSSKLLLVTAAMVLAFLIVCFVSTMTSGRAPWFGMMIFYFFFRSLAINRIRVHCDRL